MKRITIFLFVLSALSAIVGCGSKEEIVKMPVEEQTKCLFGQLREIYISKGVSELKADALVTTLRLAFAAEVKKENMPDAIRAALIYDHGVEPCVAGGKEFNVFRKYLNARRVKGEFDESQRDCLRMLASVSEDVQQKVAEQLQKMLDR